jgi:GTP cyclohydrolase III
MGLEVFGIYEKNYSPLYKPNKDIILDAVQADSKFYSALSAFITAVTGYPHLIRERRA